MERNTSSKELILNVWTSGCANKLSTRYSGVYGRRPWSGSRGLNEGKEGRKGEIEKERGREGRRSEKESVV